MDAFFPRQLELVAPGAEVGGQGLLGGAEDQVPLVGAGAVEGGAVFGGARGTRALKEVGGGAQGVGVVVQQGVLGRRAPFRLAELGDCLAADEFLPHVAQVEAYPKQDGRNMVMVLGPDKKAQAAQIKKPPRARSESTEPDAAPVTEPPVVAAVPAVTPPVDG